MAKQAWDVPTVRSIFTLDHPDFVCDPIVVKMDRDQFWITGQIETRAGQKAGSFTRRIVRRELLWVAVHDSFAVDPPFRRRRIAYSHYRKALRAYRNLGCYRVELFAQDYGSFVWPQFGFQYRWRKDRDDVAAMLDQLHVEKTGKGLDTLPEREFGIVGFRLADAEQIGAIAARTVASRHENGALEMILDLTDPITLEYLVERGIFDSEEIR
jgi:GNAT superfamily N-acetyltransferase